MKTWIVGLVLMLSVIMLVGCGGSRAEASESDGGFANAGANQVAANNEAAEAESDQDRGPNFFQSAYLSQDHEGALPIIAQLTLGTLHLWQIRPKKS